MTPQCPNRHPFDTNNLEKSLPAMVGTNMETGNLNPAEYVTAISCKVCGHVYGVVRSTWDGNLS